MELKDTMELMNSEDYKERFLAEYWQLAIRANKLGDYLFKKIEESYTIPGAKRPVDILFKQHTLMSELLKVMRERATAEDISLELNGEFML